MTDMSSTGKVEINLTGLWRIKALLVGDINAAASGPLRVAFTRMGNRYRQAMQERYLREGDGTWAPLKASTRLQRPDPKGGTGAKQIAKKRIAVRVALVALRAAAHKETLNIRKRVRKGLLLHEALSNARLAAPQHRLRKATRKLNEERSRQAERKHKILFNTGTLYAALSPSMEAPGSLTVHTPKSIIVGFGGSATHPSGKATIAQIAGYHQFGTPRMVARPILVQPPAPVLSRMLGDLKKAVREVIALSRVK